MDEGLLPEGPVAEPESTAAEKSQVLPITDIGRQLLRSKQVQAIAYSAERSEIVVFTKRAAPTNKKQLAAMPSTIGDVQIKYRQGSPNPVGGLPSLPFGGPAYVVRTVGTQKFYTCGSSISLGNFRDAGTLGCLVRDSKNVMHGLSNNHVSGGCNFAGVGLPILAPGVFDVVPACLPPFTIGFHKTSLPMVAGSADNVDPKINVDAAIFEIADEKLVSSFQGDAYDTPSTVGILTDNMVVEKFGRTTNHTHGRVVGQIYGAHPIQYSAALYGFSGFVSFDPTFAIVGVGDLFSDNGDSGSLITSTDSSGKRIAVGIVVGGYTDSAAPGGKITIALPIAPILQALGVTLVAGHNI
jgi:hypothetical protein